MKPIALLLAVCVLTFLGAASAPPPAQAETVTTPTSRPLVTPSERRDISRIPGTSAGDQQKVKTSIYLGAKYKIVCRNIGDQRVHSCSAEDPQCPMASTERVEMSGASYNCPVTCSGEAFDTGGSGMACDCEFETSDCVPAR